MGRLVPAHHSGDAGPRLSGGGTEPGIVAGRFGRKGGCPSLDERLIPLTVPEVRRLLYRLIWRHHPTNESVLRWSQWRRRHQATGPELSLPTPPETPHHISATVVLVLQSQITLHSFSGCLDERCGQRLCLVSEADLTSPVEPEMMNLETCNCSTRPCRQNNLVQMTIARIWQIARKDAAFLA